MVDVGWNQYEIALLVESYLNIMKYDVSSRDIIQDLSKNFKHHAEVEGLDVGRSYRSEGSINKEMKKVASVFESFSGGTSVPSLINDVVSLYLNDQKQFNEILSVAKKIYILLENDGSSKTLKSLSEAAMLEYLKKRGIEYLDVRSKGGCFWILENNQAGTIVETLKKHGISFHYSQDGNDVTNNRSAWWTRAKYIITNEFDKLGPDERTFSSIYLKIEGIFGTVKEILNDLIEVENAKISNQYADILIQYFQRSGIEYVDNRNKDGRFWIISSNKSKEIVKNLEAKGVEVNIGYIRYSGGKTYNTRSSYWIKVKEFDCTYPAEVRKATTPKINSLKSKKVKEMYKLNANVSVLVDSSISKDKILEDENTLEDTVYAYMYKAQEVSPFGMSVDYVAEQIKEPLSKVKVILDTADWIQRRDEKYSFADYKRNKEVKIDFLKLSSLARTKPVMFRIETEEAVGVNSWKELLAIIASKFYEINPKNFDNAILLNDIHRVVDKKHKDELSIPCHIGGDVWIELKHTPMEIIMFIKELAEMGRLDPKYINILYVRKLVW